jgi:hypothetical protein
MLDEMKKGSQEIEADLDLDVDPGNAYYLGTG